MQKKIEKRLFDLERIVPEFVALKTRFYWEREYLLSGANMLTNSVKITDTTKTEFLELISFQSDQKIWEKYWREDSCGVSDGLTCWLSISVMTRGFLEIKTTPIFEVYNIRNK